MANLKDTIINGVLQVNGKINADDKIIAPAFLGTLTGNSTSTTRLQTARKINGVAFDGTKDIFIPSASDIPIGSIVEFGTLTNIPNGWLICDGRAISRTTYDELFKIIGTTYGAGDGSTTFNLPDLRGRVLAGYKSDNTNFNTLGKKGGAETLKLTVDNLPSHNHSFTGTAHTHTLNNHTHSVPAHNHSVSAHTHSIPAHSHGLNSHKHSFSATTSSNGVHQHDFHNDGRVLYWDANLEYKYGNLVEGENVQSEWNARTKDAGAHTHTVSGTSGAATGNTANSAALTSGSAGGGNTGNSTALTTGTSNVNTSSVAGGGTVGATGAGAAISLLQPYFTTIFIIKAFIPAELPLNSSVQVIDNLTTTSATNALSANQGKILNDKKLDKTGGTMTGDILMTNNSDISFENNTSGIKSKLNDNTTESFILYVNNENNLILGATNLASTRSNNHIIPSVNNNYTLGNSTNKWKNIYATTFTGALSGNASSATQVKVTESSPATATAYNLLFTLAGNTANTDLRINNQDAKIVILEGTNKAIGSDVIYLGNNISKGNTGNKYGGLVLYSNGSGYNNLVATESNENVSNFLPAVSGTLLNSTNYNKYTVVTHNGTTTPSSSLGKDGDLYVLL